MASTIVFSAYVASVTVNIVTYYILFRHYFDPTLKAFLTVLHESLANEPDERVQGWYLKKATVK